MKIFDVILNGNGAKEFCQMSDDMKIKWIIAHTTQRDIDLIKQFIKNPPKHNDCGCGCGGKKEAIPQVQNQNKVVEAEQETQGELEVFQPETPVVRDKPPKFTKKGRNRR